MNSERGQLTVASLRIHPIKSLGGFEVDQALVTDRGFEHDRRWMFVDESGRFISQREIPVMACLHCAPMIPDEAPGGFRVTDIRDGDVIDLPWMIDHGEKAIVVVWNDALVALRAPVEFSAWFSKKLGSKATLVFMPDKSHRPVDTRYAKGITSLSDGYPYLILSQASLDDLNLRIRSSSDHLIISSSDLGMDRFRPNIVIAGGEAYQEDQWKEIMIGDTRFSLVKPCERCAIPTIDQRTGERGKEPTRTLATYRRRVGSEGKVKVEFGMNAMAISGEVMRVGDRISM